MAKHQQQEYLEVAQLKRLERNAKLSSPDYLLGNNIVIATSALLIIADLVIMQAKHAASQGADGTEYAGLAMGPFILIGIFVLLASLVATSIRRRPLPSKVRYVRLGASVTALAVTLLVAIF